ncbi:MAG TPA: PKD domain-containing protein [Tepidisphaeraceae bacterium]|nr:PKD domain-containing protein [Tepidisphaeraceae bacterium]
MKYNASHSGNNTAIVKSPVSDRSNRKAARGGGTPAGAGGPGNADVAPRGRTSAKAAARRSKRAAQQERAGARAWNLPARSAARQRLVAAAVETLEKRELLSASIGLQNGVMLLNADPSTPSRIIVHLSHEGRQIDAAVTGAAPQHWPAAEVSSIQIDGSNLGDYVRIGSHVKLPSHIAEGDGNNTILGGGGNDSITAGNGNNRINGRGGDDSITAGDGSDTLLGGAGNDTLIAGNGPDTLRGGSGNDSLTSGSGKDLLAGGAGDDTLHGGNTQDTLINGDSADPTVGSAALNAARIMLSISGADATTLGAGQPIVQGRHSHATTGAGGSSNVAGKLPGASGTSGAISAGQPGANPSAGSTGGTTGGGTTQSGSTGAGGVKVGSANPGAGSSAAGGTTTGGSTAGGSTAGGTTGGGSTTAGSTTGGSTTGGSTASGSANNGNGSGTTSSVAPADWAITTTGGSLRQVGINFSAAKTTASIVFMEQTGMAGHTVHVNGLPSLLAVGDPLTTTYKWDFGDPGTRFNDNLVGWNAAHTYDAPGSYTVTLTVTDSAGTTSVATGKVTIAADTRRKIYVDSVAGNDANTGLTPQTAVATAGRAGELVGNDTEMLFHNGQTFNVSATVAINASNVLIGTYGSGAMARIVKITGPGQSIFNIGGTSDGIVAENLVLDSMWDIATYGDAKVNARGFFVAGTNFTVRDCQFLNLDDGVNTAGQPTGVLVQDNYFGPMMRACPIWAEGYDHVYIGNTMTNSTQEHLIRASGTGVTRLMVEYNNLSRLDNSKGSLELRTASWFYVRGNIINGGTLRVGLPQGADPQYTGWGVVEGNETYKFWFNIRPGVEHLAIRDNVINYDSGAAIVLETQYSDPNRNPIDDITIDHNTAISTDGIGKFLELDGPATNISLTNNLYIAPNLVWEGEECGAVFVAGTNLDSFSQISNNIWPKMPATSQQPGDNYLYPEYGQVPKGFETAAQWAALPQVHNDQYANPASADTYSMTLNGFTAGATAPLFDPNAWKIAVAA